MGVGADHHAAGEGVVFEHDLVDDTCAGFPETDAVLVGDGGKEVIYLLVAADCAVEVFLGIRLGGDEVVAVHGGRDCNFGAASLHELQEGHLGGGVLHGHAVRGEVNIGLATLKRCGGEAVEEVCVEDLFGEGEWAAQHTTCGLDPGRHAFIYLPDHFEIECHRA